MRLIINKGGIYLKVKVFTDIKHFQVTKLHFSLWSADCKFLHLQHCPPKPSVLCNCLISDWLKQFEASDQFVRHNKQKGLCTLIFVKQVICKLF